MEQIRQEENHVATLFVAWQKKWFRRRDQISRRLELIESQLERMARQRVDAAPQLAVIGVPSDADEGASPGSMFPGSVPVACCDERWGP